MADLIELDLVVKEKDLKSSISTVERLERQLIKASKAIEQNSVSQGRYNKILLSAKRQYEQLGLSSQKATSQVHSFAKAQRASLKEASEVAQATKRASEAYAQARKEAEEANRAFDSQASAYQRLVRSMDPAYDATQRFKEAQRVLRAELSTGRISIGRYNEQLLLARKTMEVTTASSGQMGRMMSRNGVMVQQAGYQIGDFLVQVQSGQNAMVAFGQQATQMAGTLTLLGGAFVGIGTALGIAIPLITAAGAAFMRTRGSAKDAEEEVKTFEQRLSSSQSAIIAARDSIVDLSEEGLEVLRDRFGEVTEQVTTLETRLRGIALQNMVTEVQGAMDELFSDSFFDEIEEGFGNIGSAILETAPEDIKELEREISSLQAILDSTAFPSPLLQGQLKELQEELAAVTLDFQNIGSLTDELEVSSDTINSYKSLEEAVKEATSEGNFIEAADGISEMLSLFEEVGAEIDKGALANMVRLEERLREGANALQQSSSVASDFSGSLEEAARASGKLASQTSKIEVEIAKAEAQIEALKTGKDAEVAGFIAGEKAKVTALYESAKAMAAQTGNIVAMAEATLNFLDAMDALSSLEKVREELNKTRKSFKSSSKGVDEFVEESKRLNEAADPLLKFNNGVKKLDKLLAKGGLTQKAYNKGIDDLKKGLAESVPFVNNLGDAFGDFVARGFKDFKGFANSIKKEFQNLLSDMVSTALRNRLIIPLFGGPAAGVAGAAGAASAAGAAGGAAGTGLLAGASGFFGSLGAGGAAGTGLLGGAASVFTGIFGGAGVAGGGLAGGISAVGTALSGATSSIAGFGAAVGAIAVPLLAVTGIFSFFKKKVKILDSGLKLLVDGFDVVAKTFEKKEIKRFFGLSKKVRTTETDLSPEAADPLKEAVNDLQTSIMDAADSLGLGATAWDQFTYEFKLSLKGLDEAARNAAIQEEMTKLGDAFASLTGHFETMEELLATSQQRFELNNRILALQGKEEELLAIRREAEMNATHELNRTLLARVHALEDVNAATAKYDSAINVLATTLQNALREAEQAVSGALRDLSGAMASELSEANSAYDQALSGLSGALSRTLSEANSAYEQALGGLSSALSKALQDSEDALSKAEDNLAKSVNARIELINQAEDARVEGINSSFDTILANLELGLDSAKDKAKQSRQVFELLDGALRGRRVSSDDAFRASRESALSYVSGGGSDVDRLRDALGVLNEPTEQLFSSFQDYARDFSATSKVLSDSRDSAETTLTADEQAVVALEGLIEQEKQSRDVALAQVEQEREASIAQLESLLQVEEEVMSVADAVSALNEALAHKEQIELQHQELIDQFPELSESVFSVADAVTALNEATAHKDQIEAQHQELIGQFPELGGKVLGVAAAVAALNEATANKEQIEAQHQELIEQFPELEGKVIGVEDAVTALNEALAHKEQIEAQHQELIAQFPKLESVLNSGLYSISQAVNNAANAQSALAAAENRSAQALVDHTKFLSSLKASESVTDETPDAKPSGAAADKIRSQIADLEKQYANANDADRWYYDQGNGARLEKLREELAQIQKAPGFATGGMHSGGYRIVGERGPELESTGPSRVFSHKQTANMFKDPDLREAVNELRREVSGLRSEQRQMAASNSKYIKRNYDINRKWDTEGLPQTRT